MASVELGNNERIVDFSVASYKFDQHFGDTNALEKWFEQIESVYKESPSDDFESIAIKAIDKLAKKEQKYLIKEEKQAMFKLMLQLPDHRNACEKIINLKDQGKDYLAVLDKKEKRMSFKELSQCFR